MDGEAVHEERECIAVDILLTDHMRDNMPAETANKHGIARRIKVAPSSSSLFISPSDP